MVAGSPGQSLVVLWILGPLCLQQYSPTDSRRHCKPLLPPTAAKEVGNSVCKRGKSYLSKIRLLCPDHNQNHPPWSKVTSRKGFFFWIKRTLRALQAWQCSNICKRSSPVWWLGRYIRFSVRQTPARMLPVLSGGGAGLSSTGGAGAAMTWLMPWWCLMSYLPWPGWREGGGGRMGSGSSLTDASTARSSLDNCATVVKLR